MPTPSMFKLTASSKLIQLDSSCQFVEGFPCRLQGGLLRRPSGRGVNLEGYQMRWDFRQEGMLASEGREMRVLIRSGRARSDRLASYPAMRVAARAPLGAVGLAITGPPLPASGRGGTGRSHVRTRSRCC